MDILILTRLLGNELYFFFLGTLPQVFNEMPSGFPFFSHLSVHLQAVKVPHSLFTHIKCALTLVRTAGEYLE